MAGPRRGRSTSRAEDYTDLRFWKPVAGDDARAAGRSTSPNSDSVGIGAAVVLNDVDSVGAASLTERRRSTAGSVLVEAVEAATIVATTDVTGELGRRLDVDRPGHSLAAGG